MKSTRTLLASIGMLIALSASSVAEVQPPTLRETSDWIIVSGYRDYGKGALPWTVAIKKSSVKSAVITTDDHLLSKEDSSKRFQSPEEIQQLPAVIRITTDELGPGGENSRYEITGLTHATAPAMLEKILGAASKSKSHEAPK